MFIAQFIQKHQYKYVPSVFVHKPSFNIFQYLFIILMLLDSLFDFAKYCPYVPIQHQAGHTYENIRPNLQGMNRVNFMRSLCYISMYVCVCMRCACVHVCMRCACVHVCMRICVHACIECIICIVHYYTLLYIIIHYYTLVYVSIR